MQDAGLLFALSLTALFSLSLRCEAWHPAERHPPGVKSGHEVKEFSSFSHFKDIKDRLSHTFGLNAFWIKPRVKKI